MRAVRSENMFRRSYFNCCPHKILYQLIAIPTVNKIQVNFTDRGEQQEKKKETVTTEACIYTSEELEPNLYTPVSYLCVNCFAMTYLWKHQFLVDFARLGATQIWVSGPEDWNLHCADIFCQNKSRWAREAEGTTSTQKHLSLSETVVPPWVDPGAIKPEPFPPEMLQHFFPNEVTSQKCLCFSGPSCSHRKAVLASVCSNGQQPASYFQTKFSHIWV